jgi:anti-sigma factor RsiW
MNCDFTEKDSRLIDDELSEEEAKGVSLHLATCEACQRAHEDFLRLRGEIKAYIAAPDLVAQRQALRQIIASEKTALWKRRITLPAPAFALLLVAIISLGIWIAFLRQPAPARTENPSERVLTVPAPVHKDSRGALDLARFDSGGRATIYKERRTNQGGVEQ